MAEPRLASWAVAPVPADAGPGLVGLAAGVGADGGVAGGWPALAAARAAGESALAAAGTDGASVDLVVLAVAAFPDRGRLAGRSAALLDNAVNAAVHRELLLGVGLPTAVPLGVLPGAPGLAAALWIAGCALRADDAATVLVLAADGPATATGAVLHDGPGRPVRAAYGPDEAAVLAELAAPGALRLAVPGPAALPPGELLLLQRGPAGTGAVHVAG